MAHVTGGGLTENLPRVLPAGLGATIDVAAWPQPPVFDWLRSSAAIEPGEMLRTFNCGIGYVLVVPAGDVDAVRAALEGCGEACHAIGEIMTGEDEPTVHYR